MVAGSDHVHPVGLGEESERQTVWLPPFPQTNEITALRMVVNGSFQFYRNDWEDVSDDAKDFICALLVPNPERRATAKMVGELGVA